MFVGGGRDNRSDRSKRDAISREERRANTPIDDIVSTEEGSRHKKGGSRARVQSRGGEDREVVWEWEGREVVGERLRDKTVP
jgi:hypothetical protein